MATVKEPDIARAFKMNIRADKFSLKLDDVSAHTLRIMEIIEEEKMSIQTRKKREMEQKVKNAS